MANQTVLWIGGILFVGAVGAAGYFITRPRSGATATPTVTNASTSEARTTSTTGSASTAMPVAFLVADQEDQFLAMQAGVPVSQLFYVGSDPLAGQADALGSGYLAPSLPTYSGSGPTVVIGLAGKIRQGSLATLEGATRTQTAQMLTAFVTANAWTIGH